MIAHINITFIANIIFSVFIPFIDDNWKKNRDRNQSVHIYFSCYLSVSNKMYFFFVQIRIVFNCFQLSYEEVANYHLSCNECIKYDYRNWFYSIRRRGQRQVSREQFHRWGSAVFCGKGTVAVQWRFWCQSKKSFSECRVLLRINSPLCVESLACAETSPIRAPSTNTLNGNRTSR